MPRKLTIPLVKPDYYLAQIVGDEPLKRTQVTVKVWEYIKQRDLQDPSDRRSIRADDFLRPVFDGNDAATMFTLQTHLTKHCTIVGHVEA